MKIDYKTKYQERLKKNLKKVVPEIETKDGKIKISKWATKFEYPFDVIKKKIINDKIFRCVFAKDPSKQNIYQKLAAEYIKTLDSVKKFQTLPAGGKKAFYLSNGKILKGSQLDKKSKDTKSLDFFWQTASSTIYASHKYTGDDNGGAQDNQYQDIQKFLKQAHDFNEKNSILIMICDGSYYLRKDSSTGDETRLKRLERLTDNKTTFVKTIDELEEFLNSLQSNET